MFPVKCESIPEKQEIETDDNSTMDEDKTFSRSKNREKQEIETDIKK